jgi:hypothetical protein
VKVLDGVALATAANLGSFGKYPAWSTLIEVTGGAAAAKDATEAKDAKKKQKKEKRIVDLTVSKKRV